MADSLADSLKVIVPFIDPKLISSQALSNISEVASILPAIPTVWEAGFECRLGIVHPKADFLMSFSHFNGGHEILAGFDSARTLPKLLFMNPVWNTIRDFCINWTNPTSLLYENVTDIWLEFDVDEPQLAIPVPSFFFGPYELNSAGTNTFSYKAATSNYEWVTEIALKLLIDTSITSRLKQNLINCFNLLPAEAQVFQIGVMLSRQIESSIVRLCVKDIPKEKILEYLIKIGWDGDIKEIEKLISKLSEFVDTIRLNFAIGNTILPKIGFECYFERKPAYEPRLQLFLDYLVEKQLCIPDKRSAILAWPGYSHEKSYEELWPRDLVKSSTFLNSRKLSAFFRLLHHVKIVYQANKSLEAKAYLWFGHRWIDLHPASTEQLMQKAG